MALQQFYSFVKDFKGVAALISKAALLAPFLGLLLNVGPPWPAKTAVPAFTSLAEVFVLIYVFQFHTGMAKKRLERRLRFFFLLVILGFVSYIVLYSFFVYEVPVDGSRDVSGFILRPAVANLVGPGRTVETLLEGAEWDAFQIWESWTIYTTRVSLVLGWIFFFVGLAGSMAMFVTLQRKSPKAKS